MYRRCWLIAVAAAAPFVSGCYTYVPVDTTAPAPVGTRIAVDITDGGRVGLSERLGSGITRLEGTVLANDSSQYVLSVKQVAQLNGEMSKWSGESVRIDRNFINRVFERQLSRGRTYFATGVAVAAFVLIAKSQGLFGSSDVAGSPETPPPGPSQTRVLGQLRIPW